MSAEHPVEVDERQVSRVFNTLGDWIHVKQANGQAWHTHLTVDLGHSSLFHRLLHKKTLYKFPPPLAMSYPWYSLLDSGKAEKISLHLHENFPGYEGRVLSIEQALWLLEVEVTPGEEYIARWPLYKLRIRCVRKPDPKWQGFDYEVTVLENENHPVEHIWEVSKLPS